MAVNEEELEQGLEPSGEGAGDAEGGLPEEEDRDRLDLHGLFEAVLFISSEPLPAGFFVKNFGVDATHARIILDSLVDAYEERDGGVKIVRLSNGYQYVTDRRYAEQIRRVLGLSRKETLSKSMMETLAIVAYKQPIVISEIDELRGVSSRMMVANLLKKNLIKPVGRKELPGRPLAYGTTDDFLKYFGLNKLSDLPRLSEIKEFTIQHGE
ncbi:MAG TPA: SMC-Scp complex subunit ScpB [Spirochaetota bacterium]|nr:SMC-Scp complex subunit ScpB [Spirochaetota bacterium]HNT11606.1 SMC-Scp complex subunit ScpB [Spirochaetota bacterium]HNV49283.1 SMC-Scp complex subunit ScpB [Spirochaetota bacterium]HOS41181.1 SMC-Scp complex subunit ScpB [Spirochaetota bacterium]